MSTRTEYRFCHDQNTLAKAALELVVERAAQAIATRGKFVFSLAGGSTPRLLYELLGTTEQNWQHWHLIYGDERALPRGAPGRNSTTVEQVWLNRVGFPTANHHVPVMESGADVAARQYARAIAPLLPVDVALLGLGEDGHTASLFPGHAHPAGSVVAVFNSPKPPAERISLSYQTFNGAACVCFLVTGAAKAAPLAALLAGDDIPAARVHGTDQTIVFTDIGVAGMTPGTPR